MPHRSRTDLPKLPFLLLTALFATLWIAGGASRADAFGQVVVRAVAWTVVTAMLAFGPRPRSTGSPAIPLLFGAIVAVPLIQLLPLPPALWQALPGRELFKQAATLTGQPQPWRPWSIVPGATLNALSSLIVPAAVILAASGLHDLDRRRVPGLLLSVIFASTLFGLLQFSGSGFDNPLINDSAGEVSGSFANRNHFALFLAFGCALAPVWAFLDGRRPGWRTPVAVGLMLLFALTILATGSRAGLLLGSIGLAAGPLLVRRGIRHELRRYPRWMSMALVAGSVAMVMIAVLASIVTDRAVSIERAFAADAGADMRTRGLSTMLAMIRTYFPFGTGFGSFDPMFRLHEPFHLLKPTFLNHAHNDFLEIALDAGLLGLGVLAAALAWMGRAGYQAWRAGDGTHSVLPRLGSVVVLMSAIASVFDYPARTPMIMATVAIAALWLAMRGEEEQTLPKHDLHL